MDAFIEIIAKLVDSIPPETWHQQKHFPFKFLSAPRSRLFDACLFDVDAKGAWGFLWIEFHSISDLYILPFRLARYQEDADLISLPPWSLRDASADSVFYEAWRWAQKNRNPMPTANKETFSHVKYTGDASFVPLEIWSDECHTCMRLDFQVAYKIFRTLERHHSQSIEVDMMIYLSTQEAFSQYPKLLSVFEYNAKNIGLSHTAIGIKYIQNNGLLFPHFVSLLRQSRFPQKLKERTGESAWKDVLELSASLGKILADFHKTMAKAPKGHEFALVQTTGQMKNDWLSSVSEKLSERLERVMALQSQYPEYGQVFHFLPDFSSHSFEKLKRASDLGLRMQIHGNVHLNQFLMDPKGLVLLDYASDNYDESHYRRMKQPCIKDIVSMLASFKFAWHESHNTDSKKEFEFQKYTPNITEIESVFLKFYDSSLNENMNASQLRPPDFDVQTDTMRFCLLLRILKEISRDSRVNFPQLKIWLSILQEHMAEHIED